MKRFTAIFLVFSLLMVMTACGASTVISSANDKPEIENSKSIVLENDSIKADSGVKVTGSTATIAASGSYAVSGKLNDGCIIVNTGDDEGKVTIILNSADITCLSGAAISIEKASKVKIVTAAGTENLVTSGTESTAPSADASGAAISSKDDIDFEGNGTLSVRGFINNGIACKNDIDIESGTLTVYAVNNAIRGSDSVEIKGGSVAVTAGNDGIKTLTADKEGKGYVEISGGTVSVSAKGDAIAAATALSVTGGELYVKTDGDGETVSSKGLKANTGMSISGGVIDVESRDNAVSCDADVNITGGVVKLVSEKDGIRTKGGEEKLFMSGGELLISSAKKSFDIDGTMNITGGKVIAVGNYKSVPVFDNVNISSVEGKAGDKTGSLTAVYDYNTIITNK